MAIKQTSTLKSINEPKAILLILRVGVVPSESRWDWLVIRRMRITSQTSPIERAEGPKAREATRWGSRGKIFFPLVLLKALKEFQIK